MLPPAKAEGTLGLPASDSPWTSSKTVHPEAILAGPSSMEPGGHRVRSSSKRG